MPPPKIAAHRPAAPGGPCRRGLRAATTALVVLLALGGGCERGKFARVAVAQIAVVRGTPEESASKAVRLVREAAARGARWVVFPELALLPAPDGTLKDAVERDAQPVPGPLTDRMLALSRELRVNIAFGMAERRGDRLFNSVVFIDPDGIAGVYAKRALLTIGPPDDREVDIFKRGVDPPSIVWGGMRTGVLICADSYANQFWKEAADRAQLVIWPKSSGGFSADQLPDRARQLGVPIVAANNASPETPDPTLYGGSRIVDANGTELVRAASEPDAILVADVPLPLR